MVEWTFPDGQKLSDYAKKAAANTFTTEQTVKGDIHITDSGATNTRGMYFRSADHVHGIYYGGSTPNDLVYTAYSKHRFYTTAAGVTILEIMYDGIRLYHALFFRKNHADDLTYIIDDTTGNMEFHVGTGNVFKFIIG